MWRFASNLRRIAAVVCLFLLFGALGLVAFAQRRSRS